jgi:DNA-binding NarL/FixJ family response regulator
VIRVLLVDDHRMLAEAVQRVLEPEGDVEVVGVATTAADAVAAVDRLHPDVVLLDHHLPDGDGASLAAEVRTRQPGTTVLLMTGSTDDRVLARALEAGCAGILTKSEPAGAIAAAVRAAAAGDPVMPPDVLRRLLPRLAGTAPRPGHDLTPRELELLGLLADGVATGVIADRLSLSVHTVRNYIQSVLTKLGARSRLEAVAIARREGLL